MIKPCKQLPEPSKKAQKDVRNCCFDLSQQVQMTRPSTLLWVPHQV